MVRAAPCVAEVRGPAAEYDRLCPAKTQIAKEQKIDSRGLTPPGAPRQRVFAQDFRSSDAVRAPCPVLLQLGSHG